jgi:hypothetical protein
MIPKIIHYTWFSGDPFPEKIQKCIDTWHHKMPDYEFVLWDYNKIKDIDSVWLQECLKERKWAFAADFIRLYAVYHYGGIYLDTDVEVYKPFNEFLQNKMFIGREGTHYVLLEKEVNVFLTSHCFGAEPLHPFIKNCLDYYAGRHFVRCDSESIPKHLRLDMLMMPYIQSEIAKGYGYNPSLKADKLQLLDSGIAVYPSSIFGALSRNQKESYICHLADGSWREEKWVDKIDYTLGYKIKWRLKVLIFKVARQFDYLLVKIK